MNEQADMALAALFPGLQRQYQVCGRKSAYATLKRALIVKERREEVIGLSLNVYRCAYDSTHWHLTSQAPSAAQISAMLHHPGTPEYAAEVTAARRRVGDLTRATDQLEVDLKRRFKRLPDPPSLQGWDDFYEAVRAGYVQMENLASEQLDAVLALRILLLSADFATPAITPTQYHQFLTRLAEEYTEADAIRSDNAAGVEQNLKQLAAKHVEMRAEIPRQLQQRYPLPAYDWRRGAR
jgi:hypothetical protein